MEENNASAVKLTQYSRGAGCGCKIAPAVLEEILHSDQHKKEFAQLLVGNSNRDDAAVYDLGDGKSVISTTDFFMPIVDDAFDFGRIAAANAISDVYAMGGKPLMAVAILGWPVDKLPAALAAKVIEGAQTICHAANIPLAGGHSVDSMEPLFGLAVTGIVDTNSIIKNNTAKEGDLLFLTKPLGTGILSTAQKRGLIQDTHMDTLVAQMVQLNAIGAELSKMAGVHAMTDVTGFGFAGHLKEMMDGAGTSAEIKYGAIPLMDGAREYLAQRIVPDATYRNWNSYGKMVGFEKGVNVMEAFSILPDPQTNGGLLIAVHPDHADKIAALLSGSGVCSIPIGRVVPRREKVIVVFP